MLENLLLFYNLIYLDESSLNRAFDMTYQEFEQFKQFIERYQIDFPSIIKVNESMFEFAKGVKTLRQKEQLLHLDLLSEIKKIRHQYHNKIHIIGMGNFELKVDNKYQYFQIKETHLSFQSLTDPCFPFIAMAFRQDELPGIMVFSEQQFRYFPIKENQDILDFYQLLESNKLFNYKNNRYSYYIHLSDLHLGSQRKKRAVEALYDSFNEIFPTFQTSHQLKFFITGDIMNIPSEKAMYDASDLISVLKKRYKGQVDFVLGNHDMVTGGLSMATRNKTKAIAYLLAEKIKIYEEDKIILLKIDSNMNGNFARGQIGKRQLLELENELSTIDHLEDYVLIAMLHHHVYKVSKADFIKTKWNEKFIIGKLMDTSKALIDAEDFRLWLQKYHVHLVVHGHKHVPFCMQKDQLTVLSAGSSTGSLKESDSRYLSYNIIKYDTIEKRFVSAHILYKDKRKANRLRIESYRL